MPAPAKIFPREFRLETELAEMRDRGTIRVPHFQRDYVWERTRIAKLFDSIYNGFPIGSFFLWGAPPEFRHLYKDLPALEFPEPGPMDPVKMILDGQQRTRFYAWAKRDGAGPYESFGNGSAMRVSPVGWAFDDLESVLEEAKKSAEVTHNHPEGIKGAQATAAAIFLARTGKKKDEIKGFIETKFGYDLNRTVESIREVYEFDESCQGTVPEAIICFIESTDFEDAIRNAVSIGGDSDTLACITGSIAEAFYRGVPDEVRRQVLSRLPKEFIEVVDRFEVRLRGKQWTAPPAKTVMVKIASLKPNEFQHAELPEALVEKIRNFKEILAEVETMSLQTTLDNFRRDTHPEKEVEVWTSIAWGYKDAVSKNPDMTLEQKKKVFGGLLDGSLKTNPIRIIRPKEVN